MNKPENPTEADTTGAGDPLSEASDAANKDGNEGISKESASDADRCDESDAHAEVPTPDAAAIKPEPLVSSPVPASHDDELDFGQWIEVPPGFDSDLLDRIDVKAAEATDGYIPQEDECVFYLYSGDFAKLLSALACSTPKDRNQSVFVRLTFESDVIVGRSYHNSTFTAVSVRLAQSGHLIGGLHSVPLVFSFDDLKATESGLSDLTRFTYTPTKNSMSVYSKGFERPLQIERHERFIDHSQGKDKVETSSTRVSLSREIFLRCLLQASSQTINDHVVDYANIIQFEGNVAGGGSFRAFAYASSRYLDNVRVVIHCRFLPFLIRFLDPGFWPALSLAENGSYYIIEADRATFGFEKTWRREATEAASSHDKPQDNAPIEQSFPALMLFSKEYQFRYKIVVPNGALLPVLTAFRGSISELDVEVRFLIKDTERKARCTISVEDVDGEWLSYVVAVDRRDSKFDGSIINIKLSLNALIIALGSMSSSNTFITVIEQPQFIILEDESQDIKSKTIINYEMDHPKGRHPNRRHQS